MSAVLRNHNGVRIFWTKCGISSAFRMLLVNPIPAQLMVTEVPARHISPPIDIVRFYMVSPLNGAARPANFSESWEAAPTDHRSYGTKKRDRVGLFALQTWMCVADGVSTEWPPPVRSASSDVMCGGGAHGHLGQKSISLDKHIEEATGVGTLRPVIYSQRRISRHPTAGG